MRTFQNAIAHSKPPHPLQHKPPPWRVALLINLVDDYKPGITDPEDFGSEFDQLETAEAIAQAIEAEGHWVHICSADHTLPESLTNLRPHIAFNIAEGVRGDAREAQAPALCELLGIPYTGSRVLSHAISLDKAQTKRIWQTYNLPTPAFQEFRSGNEPLDPRLHFPLIVKPVREGTGMGIDGKAVVKDKRELRERVSWVIHTYQQPALVEEFLPGREFTVGFIGNPGNHDNRYRPWLYDVEGYHLFPVLEIESTKSISPGLYSHDAKAAPIGEAGAPAYLCPATIPAALHEELSTLTKVAAQAIDVCDVSRVDVRLAADGKPYLMEINTLPGLNPAISDLCIMGSSEGISHQTLITEILYLAAARHGMPFSPLGYKTPMEVNIPVHLPIPEPVPLRTHVQRARHTRR